MTIPKAGSGSPEVVSAFVGGQLSNVLRCWRQHLDDSEIKIEPDYGATIRTMRKQKI